MARTDEAGAGGRDSVEVAGVRLAYRVTGTGPGTPVVLVHALGGSAADWEQVAEPLAVGRRVYAVDLRGHGASDRPGAYTLDLLAADLLGLLDAWGLERVDLVGHSLGGVVAYRLAAQRPERVERLVLEDVPAPRPREPLPAVRPPGEPGFDWALVPALRAELDDPDPVWLERLADITADTLVVSGGLRSPVPRAGIEELARLVPRARIVTIPVGHLVHAAEPAAFTQVVAAFLRRSRVTGAADGRAARRDVGRPG